MLISIALLFTGCTHINYYFQSASGHLSIMGQSRPVKDLLDAGKIDPTLRAKLLLSQRIRDFASQKLSLPDNDSFRSYADIGRPYVVWSVVATPAYSLKPQQWCFLVVGCLSYRGFFDQQKAIDFANRLEREGMDVAVSGVQAYSTLGWFDDPLLNTLIDDSTSRLVEVIVHELAHQVIYFEGDTAINEAFATAVGRYGVQQWHAIQADQTAMKKYRQDLERGAAFKKLLLSARSDLQHYYAGNDKSEKGKQEIFDRLQRDYLDLKKQWNNDARYDRWMSQGLNNSHLALLATYEHYVPAFLKMIETHQGNMTAFYDQMKTWQQLSSAQRKRKLDALMSM